MKDLSNIDLVAIDCARPFEALKALEYCNRFFKFNKSILFTDQVFSHSFIQCHKIEKLSWQGYSEFILRLNNYTNADYVMMIHEDGHIVNPHLWTDEFLNYDYIGAPWPNTHSWLTQPHMNRVLPHLYRTFPRNRVGNGGFSIRSKKFLQFSSQFENCDGFGEDNFLCCVKYDDAIQYGIKYAPFELAQRFSYENSCTDSDVVWPTIPKYNMTKHFGWHGKYLTNSKQLLQLKYQYD